MRIRRDVITYKLPAEFVERHRLDLEAIDWSASQVVTLPLGWPQDPVVEMVAGRGGKIVRPATPKSANLIRRYSETLS